MEEENDLVTVRGASEKSLGHGLRDHLQSSETQAAVQGTATIVKNDLRHLVVAETWPSLGFSLAATGSQQIGLILQCDTTRQWLQHWDTTSNDEQQFSFIAELGADRVLQSAYDVLWIQGNLNFVASILEHNDTPAPVVAIYPGMRRNKSIYTSGPVFTHGKVGGLPPHGGRYIFLRLMPQRS